MTTASTFTEIPRKDTCVALLRVDCSALHHCIDFCNSSYAYQELHACPPAWYTDRFALQWLDDGKRVPELENRSLAVHCYEPLPTRHYLDPILCAYCRTAEHVSRDASGPSEEINISGLCSRSLGGSRLATFSRQAAPRPMHLNV